MADVDIGRAVSVWAARVARGSLACADPVADRGGGEGEEDPWRGRCCGAWAWAWCCRCRCRSGDSAVDECRISNGSGGVECPLARRRSGFRCTTFCSLAIRSDIYSPGRSGRARTGLARTGWSFRSKASEQVPREVGQWGSLVSVRCQSAWFPGPWRPSVTSDLALAVLLKGAAVRSVWAFRAWGSRWAEQGRRDGTIPWPLLLVPWGQ